MKPTFFDRFLEMSLGAFLVIVWLSILIRSAILILPVFAVWIGIIEIIRICPIDDDKDSFLR